MVDDDDDEFESEFRLVIDGTAVTSIGTYFGVVVPLIGSVRRLIANGRRRPLSP